MSKSNRTIRVGESNKVLRVQVSEDLLQSQLVTLELTHEGNTDTVKVLTASVGTDRFKEDGIDFVPYQYVEYRALATDFSAGDEGEWSVQVVLTNNATTPATTLISSPSEQSLLVKARNEP